MKTIAENLQILVDQKKAIKQSLENQGKEPTEKISTYAGLIDSLENPDQVTYCVTVDGENKAYAVLYGEERAELTATPNDIRLGTTAITDKGITEGEKDIPSYYSAYGSKFALAGSEASIKGYETNYNQIMLSLATYESSMSKSTAVNYVSIGDSLYEVGSGKKISDITKDAENNQIFLGIIPTEILVIRFFLVREEV